MFKSQHIAPAFQQASPVPATEAEMAAFTDAVRAGNIQAVRDTLDSRPEAANWQDGALSVLLLALQQKYPYMATLLIDKGADIEAKDNDGWTPLIWAAKDNLPGVVVQLIEKGAVLEARAISTNETALVMCGVMGSMESAQHLLAAGADITATDSRRLTALQWAVRGKHGATAGLLRDFPRLQAEREEMTRREQAIDEALQSVNGGLKAPLNIGKPLQLKAS